MDLSIIIVNYNTKNLVLKCVQSINDSKPSASFEIIIIDNSSDLNERLKKSNKYSLILNKENLGFAKGVNQGIKIAKGKNILLLNSDTKVEKNAIDELLKFAKDNPSVGAVGPKLTNEDGTTQASCYHFPNIFRAIRQYWFGERGAYEKYIPSEDTPTKVDALVMAAFLITQKGLSKVGRLNEKYFMYFEDMDYARNLRKQNLDVYYDPKSVVRHIHGASGKKIADEKNQWRRLIPSSKIYHGNLMHSLINLVLWSGQKLGKFIPVFLIILFTIPAFYKLIRPGYFPMQDDLQAFRTYEMQKCIPDLQIPCRWVPDAGYQYGYPQFNYYPPLPYYVGVGLHYLGFQYIDAVKILFIAGYILSAVTMFILVDSIAGTWPGFVAALLYTYIPYKATEVFVRGAMSEFWAQIFFPLIFWAVYKLIKTGKAKYMIWLSVSAALLLSTHVLMSLIFVPAALIWALFWLIETKWKNFWKVAFGGLIGFGLSAFFTLPVLFERQFVHTESLIEGYFDYRQHFLSLKKLLLSMEWGYGSSGFPNEKLNLSTGIPHWIIGLIIAPVFALLTYKKNKKLSLLAIVFTLVELLVLFMMHVRSGFIWAKIPTLWYLQFPWRFLAVSIFLLCLLCGLVVYFLPKFKYIGGILFVVISFLLYFQFFTPKAWLNITDADKFSGVSWEKQLTISIFDYLPLTATLPPWQKAPDLPEVLSGQAKFSDYTKGSDFQTGAIDVTSGALVRLPLFDFPGMTTKIDGKVVPHINDNCSGERYCLGLITFNIPSGTHKIEARLTNTPVREVGNILTLISFLTVIFLVFKMKNEKILSK